MVADSSNLNGATIPQPGLESTAALVDVTIPVHTALRPIRRAVTSVIDGTRAPVRVTVVAHNIDPVLISANLGDLTDNPSVRVVPLSDGVFSPAGPLNHGLDLATAPWVSVMGSDDELEAGALDSWLAVARETGADVVIPVLRHDSGRAVADPPVRRKRWADLDPVKDRLAYRSSPLGIFSREAVGPLRFSPGLASGEDLAFTTHLWFSGAKIAFDRKGPCYRIHDDAGDRITLAPKSITQDFAFLDFIDVDGWVSRRRRAQRQALAVKLMRAHLFDAILNRMPLLPWSAAEREAFAEVVARIEQWSPHARRFLSIADRHLLDAALAPRTAAGEIARLMEARGRYGHPLTLLPRNPLYALHRQAPFRTLFAGYAVQNG